MKKLLVFPYHPDLKTLLDFNDTLKDYTIIGVCSYKEDSSITDRINKSLGSSIQTDELIHACDTVLILDNYRNYKDDKYYQIIRLAIEKKKELLLTPNAYNALDMSEYIDKYNLLEYTPILDTERFMKLDYLGRKKYVIETPVIAVLGMGKNCEKFKVQLMLKHFLDKQGYRSSWISSNPLGSLWGGYTLPDFIHSNCVSFEEKILKLNNFIYRLSLAEQPDILIIGVPEGISEFRVDEFNHFGEYPLIVGSALSIDSAILCTYFMDIQNAAGIEHLCNRCYSKFDIPVQALAVGDVVFEAIEGSNKIEYSFLERSYLDKHYTTSVTIPIPLFPVWDKIKSEYAMKEILKNLENNADAV